MTLTKSHLIETIAERNGFTRKKSTETIENLLEIIKSSLASGEDVMISGFGKFCVKVKRERRGRNQRPTPIAIDLPKSKYYESVSHDQWMAQSLSKIFKKNPKR